MTKTKLLMILLAIFLLTISLVVAKTQIFSNNLDSMSEINSAGGAVQGSSSFIDGVDSQAISLTGNSAVYFSSIGSLSDSGTIEFWVKPEFNIKTLPKFSTAGLLEVGDFPFSDTFGVWAYRSEYGPVIVYEIKDSEGVYRQAWSRVNSFKPEQWHHIAIVWKCNQKALARNYARVYVDGVAGKINRKMCQEIDLSNKDLRIGTTGYYSSQTKAVDKLEVFDFIKTAGAIRKDYRNFKPK